jgi:hypothetical protein
VAPDAELRKADTLSNPPKLSHLYRLRKVDIFARSYQNALESGLVEDGPRLYLL